MKHVLRIVCRRFISCEFHDGLPGTPDREKDIEMFCHTFLIDIRSAFWGSYGGRGNCHANRKYVWIHTVSHFDKHVHDKNWT